MKNIIFGASGLETSEMGIGMAALGRPGYINLGHADDLNKNYEIDAMQSHSHKILTAAYESGVRYIDAARSYGKAELFLSNWLSGQSDLTCGSKWGYTYTADWAIDADAHEIKEHNIDVLNRQIDESRDLLAQQLNIYHIHSATLESGVLDNTEVINRLWELREEGLIIGLSLSGTAQADTLKKALSIKNTNTLLFGSVQLTFNILEQSIQDMGMRAFDNGLGVIVKESLANGRLTSRNREQNFTDKQTLLTDMASAYGITIDALAIAFGLQQKWTSIVLSGAANEDHLKSNLNACGIEIDKSDMQRLSKLNEVSGDYWAKRSNLKWN